MVYPNVDVKYSEIIGAWKKHGGLDTDTYNVTDEVWSRFDREVCWNTDIPLHGLGDIVADVFKATFHRMSESHDGKFDEGDFVALPYYYDGGWAYGLIEQHVDLATIASLASEHGSAYTIADGAIRVGIDRAIRCILDGVLQAIVEFAVEWLEEEV